MDVVDDAPLLFQGALGGLAVGRSDFEPVTEFVVFPPQALPPAVVVAAQFPDQEAQGYGQQHPHGHVCCFIDHATFSEGFCSWITRWTVARETPCDLAIWPRLWPRRRPRRIAARSSSRGLRPM